MVGPELIPEGTPEPCRAVLTVALGYVGVKESTGRNDGPQIDRFKPSWARGQGHAWCAFWATYVLRETGVAVPWWGSVKRLVDTLPRSSCAFPGALFAWVSQAGTGHIGFVLAVDESETRIGTVEGNAGDAVRAQLRDVGEGWVYLDPYAHAGVEVDRLAYAPGLPALPEAGRGQGTR